MLGRFPVSRWLIAAVVVLLAGIGRFAPAAAQQEGVPVYPKDSPAINEAKQLLIFDELRHERAEAREHARAKQAGRAHRGRGDKVGNVVDEDVMAGRLATGAKAKASPLDAKFTLSTPTNTKLNDKTGDGATAGQAEERSAIVGKFGIGAWNDGQGFTTGGDVQALSYTTNGGVNWIRTPATGSSPAGNPPHFLGSPTRTWTSDPVVSANEKAGEFWYEGLININSSTNGVGMVKATFPGGIFTWGTPRIVVSYNSSTDAADKE